MSITTSLTSASPSLSTQTNPPFSPKLPPTSTTISFPISPLPHRQIKISSQVALRAEPTILFAEEEEPMIKTGCRVKVRGPLKVYHVPRVPEVELSGMIGELKENVTFWRGKSISANLPYRVEFVLPNVQGRNGPLRFSAHLKENEFEHLG